MLTGKVVKLHELMCAEVIVKGGKKKVSFSRKVGKRGWPRTL